MVIGTAKAYSSGVIHDVMMEALHRFSSSVWPTSVYTWLSFLNAQEAGCHSSCEYFLLVFCEGGTTMLLVAKPNKTCILCSMFLMAGTSAGTYSTLWLPQ